MTRVEFDLTGGTLRGGSLITTARPTPYGWIAGWNSASVPNGTYRLQSVAYNTLGNVGHSADVVISVKNQSDA